MYSIARKSAAGLWGSRIDNRGRSARIRRKDCTSLDFEGQLDRSSNAIYVMLYAVRVRELSHLDFETLATCHESEQPTILINNANCNIVFLCGNQSVTVHTDRKQSSVKFQSVFFITIFFICHTDLNLLFIEF